MNPSEHYTEADQLLTEYEEGMKSATMSEGQLSMLAERIRLHIGLAQCDSLPMRYILNTPVAEEPAEVPIGTTVADAARRSQSFARFTQT